MSENTIVNMPASGEDVVIRDLVDKDGVVIVPGAVYRRLVQHILVGINSQLTTAGFYSLEMGDSTHSFMHPRHQKITSWHVKYAGNPACLIRFNGLSFKCGFSLVADNEAAVMLVPNFKDDTIQKTLWWSVLDGDLWLLATPKDTFMVMTSKRFNGALWRLPTPNVYENGRVCLGNTFTVDPTVAPHLDAERRLRRMMESTWNTDLLPVMSRVQDVFRWNVAEEQIPITADEAIRNSDIIMNNELSQLILGVLSDA